MRLVALLVVVAIIYLASERQELFNFGTSKAVREADAVLPVSTPYPQTAYPGSRAPAQESGVRAPVTRTRKVMDQVKDRNDIGGF